MGESNRFDQSQRPLFAALTHHEKKEQFSFHVPGHKNGLNWIGEMAAFRDFLKLDQTEVTGLDYLHEPSGVLKESQELLTAFYQSQQSYYLVNGSTVGNLAMILGGTAKGGCVFVDRNVHQSVIHALELNELQPIFLAPEIKNHGEEVAGISLKTLKAAFEKYSNVEALILTYPMYDGGTYPIQELIQMAKENQCLTLVDEAHGAHFVLGKQEKRMPMSSLDLGADIVVQSAHKMLPAMTQGAYLHIGPSLPIKVKKRVEHYLHVLQSSSPSYVLMLSLEYARWFLANLTDEDIEASLQLVKDWSSWFEEVGLCAKSVSDPLKLSLSSDLITGNDLSKWLENMGLYPELVDVEKVVLTFPLIQKEQLRVLQPTSMQLAPSPCEKGRPKERRGIPQIAYVSISSLSIDYIKQQNLDVIEIPLKESIGRISAENVIPYPPGVPFLLKGEQIETAHLEQLFIWQSLRMRIVGLTDEKHISVYCDR